MIDLYLINKFLLNNLINIEKLSKYSRRNSNSRNSRRNSNSRNSYSWNSKRNYNSRNSRRNSNSRNSNNYKLLYYRFIFFYLLWLCYSIWIIIISLQYYVNCNNSKIGISVLIPLTFSTIYSFIHYILDDCKKIN